jgi:hypothetical protein
MSGMLSVGIWWAACCWWQQQFPQISLVTSGSFPMSGRIWISLVYPFSPVGEHLGGAARALRLIMCCCVAAGLQVARRAWTWWA